jgi:spermidine/putrescine transport system ATP-binding protein
VQTALQHPPQSTGAMPGPAQENLITVSGLTKTFGQGPLAMTALDAVTLTIAPNEFFTLLGPSGCGKTTLLRLLAGFEHPTAGTILLDGHDLTATPPNRRPINTVFQSYALFPHLNVEQNIGFGLERLGKTEAEVKARVARMLQLVRLDGFAARRPSQLSGGQQQRVALARALAPNPRLLLLDEPLSALDQKLRREMQSELKRMQRETGIAFVLVTHDQEEALSMSDRIAVMNAGRILQVGSPTQIYDRPVSRFVADFIGEANILPGAVLGQTAAHVAIRPERLSILLAAAAGAIPATLREITYLGGSVHYDAVMDDGHPIAIVLTEPVAGLAPGTRIHCAYDPRHLRLLED